MSTVFDSEAIIEALMHARLFEASSPAKRRLLRAALALVNEAQIRVGDAKKVSVIVGTEGIGLLIRPPQTMTGAAEDRYLFGVAAVALATASAAREVTP